MKLRSLSSGESKELITIKQAATILELSYSTVKNLRQRKLIKSELTTDNRVLFNRKDIETYKIKRSELKEKRQREAMGIV